MPIPVLRIRFTSTTLSPALFSLATTGGVTATSFTGLTPGIFDVAERTTAGWDQTGATCLDGSDPASIDLGLGGQVTCTYVSRPEPTALEEVDEPTLDKRMFLPLINR